MKKWISKWVWLAGIAVFSLMAIILFSMFDPANARLSGSAQTTPPGMGEALGRLFLALFLILGLIAVLAWLAKAYLLPRLGNKNSASSISILETKIITPKHRIVVARVYNQVFILGVSDQNISMLAEITDSELIQTLTSPDKTRTADSSFKRYLQQMS